jgi:hypothetical protein
MDKIFFISSIIILLIVLFIVINKIKELRKEQKLTADEIWERKRKDYELELNSLNTTRMELLENYNNLLEDYKRVSGEVKLKEDFNNSLFKIREEELNRIIEEKKKEGIKRVNAELEKIHQDKLTMLNAEYVQFESDQQEIKRKTLAEIGEIKNLLDDYRSQRESVNLAILREKELKEKENFYKIVIPECDQEDMETLKSIGPRLRNREALNKLIYDVFVKRPLNELIKRITNGREISGIYKITYIKTGEAYIGKTTNISTRWQNHIKTACGLEGAARTTFHNRLEQDGIWNYTFEVLEEVPKDKLGEREKFYIELYGTDTQLNMKKGG